jgi:anti-anti-sigma factor
LLATRHGSAHVIQVTGDLDPASANQLEGEITQLIAEQAPGLDTAVIDLIRAGVNAVSVSALLAAARACRGALTLRVAADEPALSALRLTGLDDHLAIHAGLDDALNAAQPAGPGQLRCAASAWPGYALVTVTGECDTTTVARLTSVLTEQAAQDTRRIILGLSGLRFLDSRGLHSLIKARASLADRDKSLDLVNPRSNVVRVFELTGAGTVFRVYPTLASAVADA